MPDDSRQVTVAGISGSLRPGSYTSMAVHIALRGAAQFGAQTHFLDLKKYGLTLLDENSKTEGVRQWRADIAVADGLIIGTPEYHGSFSGVLKNALDFLGFSETEGKMIGLVGVSAGAMGAFDAMSALRSVGRALHAWVIPKQVAVPEAWRVFTQDGRITNPEIERRLLEAGQQVAKFSHLHKCGQIREFLQDWEKAPVNPGGEARID
jgi:NAD(P)H-dependent FMN reductase